MRKLMETTSLIAASTCFAAVALNCAPVAAQTTSSSAATDGDKGSEITVTARRFTSDVSTSSSKLAQPVAETPQSVIVLDEQLFDNLGLRNYTEATDYIAGITTGGAFGNQFGIIARGYGVGGANSFRVNGAPLGTGSVIDSVAISQVEFVKGGAGTTFGEGGPGGFLNLTTRRGGADLQFGGQAQVGSFDLLRGEAFMTGPVDGAGRVRVALAGSYDQSNTFIRFERNTSATAYGALDFDLSETLKLSLTGYYQRSRNKSFNTAFPAVFERDGNGNLIDVRFPDNLPQDTFGGALWNLDGFNLYFVQSALEWNGSEAFNLAVLGGYTNRTNPSKNLDLCCETTPAGDTDAYNSYYAGKASSLYGEVRAFGRFTSGVVDAQYLVSAEYRRRRTQGKFVYDYAGPYNIYNPRFDYPDFTAGREESEFVDFVQAQAARTYSLSATSIVKLGDSVIVTVGARQDWFKAAKRDFSDGVGTLDSFERITGSHTALRGSVMYEVLDETRIYYSYGETFEINLGRTCANEPTPPETGKIHEIGVKSSLSRSLLLSAAAYKIKTVNNLISLPSDACLPLQGPSGLGEGAQSKGVEVELTGKLRPNWTIIAGYGYTKAEYRDEGELLRTAGAAPHQLSLFTVYDFERGALKGLGLGGGFVYLSARDGTAGPPDERLRLESRFRADASIYYQVSDAINVSLNIKNVFDSTDIASPLYAAAFQNGYLPPRSFVVTANMKM